MNEQSGESLTPAPKSGILAKLDNFWYHYKWHSLIALFLIITVTVCSLQMCSRESYDAYIVYAGSHTFNRQSTDGDFPEYNKTVNTFSHFISDYDGDGDVNLSFRDLYAPTEDELKNKDESYFQRAYNDKTTLSGLMVSGDYFICLFSPAVFNSFDNSKKTDEPQRFTDLSYLVPEGVNVEYYNEAKTAIYLSSTPLCTLAGLSQLPEDTLICLRSTGFSTQLNKKENQKMYTRSKEILIKMLEYGD